ncbi:hypothetical protein MASR1M12_21570 [Erysipelotrichia bacterium]
MKAADCIRESADGALIMVLAIPRSSRTEIVDIQQERCRIRVKAPPVDGEANAALVEALAKIFGLPKKMVVQTRGQTGKQKTFLLSGLSKDDACSVIDRIISEKGSSK